MKRSNFIILGLLISILFLPNTSTGHEAVHKHKNYGRSNHLSPIDSHIEFYKNQIKEDPNEYYTYTKLGELYIQKGRETGAAEYYIKAEEVLTRAIELYTNGYAAYIYLGQVSSYNHDFRKTIEHAKKAIELRPDKGVSYGVLGDAFLELGMYGETRRAYNIMFSIDKSFYSYSRIAQIKDLMGDTNGAIEAMNKSIKLGVRQNLPNENIAWAEVILGSLYLKKGDLKEARKQYNNSIQTFDNYYLALEHLAEVNTLEGNYEDAARLYEKVLEISQKAKFNIALGDVYKKLGKTKKSNTLHKNAFDMYEKYIQDGNTGHLKELILFYSDNDINLDKALKLAKGEIKNTSDIYAYDTLAWVYYKLGEFDKAQDAIYKSLRLGTKDARLFYHAGMIYYKLGVQEKAKKYLNLAINTNPHFNEEAVEESKKILIEIS